MYALPGTTPDISRGNLSQWLNAVAISLNLLHSFVLQESNNTRVPGCYQQLSPEEAATFRRVRNSIFKRKSMQLPLLIMGD